MNIRYLNLKGVVFCLFSALLMLSACDPDEELVGPDRLFRPTIKGEMVSRGNWLAVNWQKNKGADSYKVDISRDTFKTIDFSAVVDTNYFMFDNLEWDQLYQVQVQALAQDPSKNSGVGFLGEFKTAKFPTILLAPTSNDITDAVALVKWKNSGERATSLRVYRADDRETLIKEVELTDEDIENEFKRVTGLTGSTEYVIYAYSGETLRGWEYYTTKAPLVFAPGSNIVDLRESTDNPAILQETIQAGLPAGSVIILNRGQTYTINTTLSLSGSLTLVSGLGFEPIAKVVIANNFDIAPGSSIDSLKFKDVNLRGTDFASRYVMNPNVSGSASIGKILFESCNISNFRGVTRFRTTGGTFVINRLEFNKCLVDSIGNYGIVTIDTDADAKVNNIILKNSTFSRVEVVIVSKSNSESVVIENCTFYKAPRSGNWLVRYRNANANTVANGIKIYNTILGTGWAKVGEEANPADVRGVQANAPVDVSNSYSTSDYVSTSDPITGLIPYSRESTYLFKNPENKDFTIADLTFAGKSTAGDPRWRK